MCRNLSRSQFSSGKLPDYIQEEWSSTQPQKHKRRNACGDDLVVNDGTIGLANIISILLTSNAYEDYRCQKGGQQVVILNFDWIFYSIGMTICPCNVHTDMVSATIRPNPAVSDLAKGCSRTKYIQLQQSYAIDKCRLLCSCRVNNRKLTSNSNQMLRLQS
jgi:hypothetical protein